MGNTKTNFWLENLLKTLPFISFTGLILIPVGITFLCLTNKVSIKEHIVDYTDCTAFSIDSDGTSTCAEKVAPCICYLKINITDNLEGDVTVYFELESFDQLRTDYINSRDDNQLMGKLAAVPSVNCEPFRYVMTESQKMPISPCGTIADTMFNDTFELSKKTSDRIYIPFVQSGILTDAEKVGYHNPVNWEDLKNFSKPINWVKNIWELDTTNPDNNGFQNEIFIGWMKTEWKRKPYARVNQTQTDFENGLTAGSYVLRVGYNYPTTRYNGRRKFIITAKLATANTSFNIIGIISVVIGSILLVTISVVFFMYKRFKDNEDANNGHVDAADENLTSNHQPNTRREEDQ